ncbi:MAG: NADP-dependent oxidoreductase [Acidimicrobiales bacterium]
MRVIGVTPDTYGGPQALQIYEVPDRPAGPGEIRLRVHAATVNPTDTFTRNGSRHKQLQALEPPYVPGMDVAGIVEEIGPDVVTDLAVGDRAMAIVVPHGRHGGYADEIVLPAGSVARAPAGATLVEAATLPMNALTARLALDRLALRAGAVLGVTGAAGAFGGYVTQLAKADGLTVIADAAPADEALVAALGADTVITRGDDVADRFRSEAPDGVDGLADGAIQHALVVPAVRDGGGLASVRPFSGGDAETGADRGVVHHMVWVRDYAEEQAKLDRLGRQVEEGLVSLRVAAVYPPDRAGDAHARLEAGGTRGRLVIEFRPEP